MFSVYDSNLSVIGYCTLLVYCSWHKQKILTSWPFPCSRSWPLHGHIRRTLKIAPAAVTGRHQASAVETMRHRTMKQHRCRLDCDTMRNVNSCGQAAVGGASSGHAHRVWRHRISWHAPPQRLLLLLLLLNMLQLWFDFNDCPWSNQISSTQCSCVIRYRPDCGETISARHFGCRPVIARSRWPVGSTTELLVTIFLQ